MIKSINTSTSCLKRLCPRGVSSLYFLCLPLLFASCAQSMEEPGDGFGAHGKVVPLGVQASLAVSKGAAGGKEEASSRAGGTSSIGPGSEIFVFLIDGSESNGYKPVYNKLYKCESGGLWSSKDPIYVDDRAGNVVAYYDPNHANPFLASEGSSVTTTNTTLTAQNLSDGGLWYYDRPTKTVSSTNLDANPTIAFQMKPAYAQLSFKISCNKNYPTSPCITQIVIKPAGDSKFYTSGTLDIATGTFNGTTQASIYTIDTSGLPMGSTGIPAGGTDTSVNLLFPAPQTCKGLTLTLTVNGKELSVTIPETQFTPAGQPSGTLASGSQYTIHLYFTEESVITFKGVETGEFEVDPKNPGINFPVEIE